MSYISLSTNLVAKCDIQVDGTKVADKFDLPKFEAKKITLEEMEGYIRRVFTFLKFTFRVKRRGAGLNHLQSKNLTPYPSLLLPLYPSSLSPLEPSSPHYSTSVDMSVVTPYYIYKSCSCPVVCGSGRDGCMDY